MRQVDFQKMKEIEKEEEMNDLDLGDFFLYGRNVIAQKQGKQPGQTISHYEVIEKNEITGVISYAPVFDYLEED